MDAIFLPSLWLFAIYISDGLAAALGLVWIAGRILYMTGYSQAAKSAGGALRFRQELPSCCGWAPWARSAWRLHSSMKAGWVNRDLAFRYSEAVDVSDAAAHWNT